MAAQKGINSLVSLEEAETYFADRLDAAAWIEADATAHAQALVTATAYFDTMAWRGVITDLEQPLSFPRSGDYYDAKYGTSIILSGIPARISKATFELAYHLLNNDGLLDVTGEVENFELGSIVMENIRSPEKLPHIVRALVDPLRDRVTSGTRMVWRAN